MFLCNSMVGITFSFEAQLKNNGISTFPYHISTHALAKKGATTFLRRGSWFKRHVAWPVRRSGALYTNVLERSIWIDGNSF